MHTWTPGTRLIIAPCVPRKDQKEEHLRRVTVESHSRLSDRITYRYEDTGKSSWTFGHLFGPRIRGTWNG